MSTVGKRLAIVTQDPANYGGVLRLVEFIYRRAEAAGMEPTILHYAKFSEHPELHCSISNLFRGELNLIAREKEYDFRGMRACAIGAWIPEWEPQRIRSNRTWRKVLDEYDTYILVTGSAQTGLPLVQSGKKFIAWVSAAVEDDRRKRLSGSLTISARFEKLGLPTILRAESLVLGSASHLMVVSNDTQQQVSRISGVRSEVWPFPVDTVKFSPGSEQARLSSPNFLFVGRANDPRKRIDLFLSAAAGLRNAHPELDFSLTIVSSVPPDSKEAYFRTEVLSHVSEEQLIALYRRSTALILTSEQEGLGIAAMEAMACSLPVISTRCGGPETFIEDELNGFFVSDDPEAIAKYMYELAIDPSLRTRTGAAARKRIEDEFSEQVWNQKFEDLFRDN